MSNIVPATFNPIEGSYIGPPGPTGTTGTELNLVRQGELASNLYDRKLYSYDGSEIFEFGTNSFLGLTGGTITGNTTIQGSLTVTGNTSLQIVSATSVYTNYIDFFTGTTDPTPVAGRVYYDSSENALSYYPSTPNMDVTLNIGQETLVRVHNTTGSIILNGQACNINGTAFDGHPSVVLADASGSGSTSIVSGIATHDIPVNSDGFITNFGLVRDLSITGVTVGSIIYLSDTNPGGFIYDTSSLEFSSRVNRIGRVIITGVTGATIFVNIENENTSFSLSESEKNILNGNNTSTGVYEYTGATIASSTTINVPQLKGWIVNNTYGNATEPEIINVNYSGQTGVTITNIANSDITYLLINSGVTLVQQVTFPTPQERRENIYLGKVIHNNRTSIATINQTVDFTLSPVSQLRDLWTPIKLINTGILVTSNGANLNFNTSAGELWGNGINWTDNQLNPDNVAISANTAATFQYRVQTGGTFSNTTNIIPGSYDLNGVVTAIGGGANSSTNQRIYLFPNGNICVQFGQQVYSTLALALAGQQSEIFVTAPLNSDNGILIGLLAVNKNATDLSNSSQAVFVPASKFGENIGGVNGNSTTSLQQAYNNSTSPEIIINSTLDGLTIQNGTGNADNITDLIQGNNTAGNTTSYIKADGTSLFNSIIFSGGSTNPTILSGQTSIRGITDNGFTRIEVNNEGAQNLVLGRDVIIVSLNNAGQTLTRGQVVYVNGTTSLGYNKIGLAKSDSTTTTPALGIVINSATTSGYTEVIRMGVILNVDTSAFSSGDTLYLSSTVAGGLQNTKPLTPNLVQRIGTVLLASTGGTILVSTAMFVGGQESGTINPFVANSGITTTTLSANTISATTIGASGNCVTDLYISNIHSCSPLNIQPNDEGNVYFGSTSGVTIDLSNNRLGVGIANPTAKLHVNNTSSSNSFLVEDDTNPDSTPFVIDNSGNVGIGTGTPSEKLEVSGKTKTTTFQLTTTPTAGYVLTSDVSGNGTWQAQAAGGAPTLRNVTATTTFATPNETINCTGNTFTVNLPTAVGIQGTTYTLVNSGIGVITLDANGTETINGSLTIVLSKQYISRTVQSDGSNWIII